MNQKEKKDHINRRFLPFVVALCLVILLLSTSAPAEVPETDSGGMGIPETPHSYRISFWRAPQDADRDSIVDLAWKHGPAESGSKNKWGDPIYYQLLEDYTINLTSYFKDYTDLPDHTPYPSAIFESKIWRTSFRSDAWRIFLDMWINNSLSNINWDYIRLWVEREPFPSPLGKTMMTIKKGYRWDGPSINWPELIGGGRLAAKPSALMRASMVHDAFYDLMRLGLINHDTATSVIPIPNSSQQPGWFNRLVADCMFYMISIQDGYYSGKAFDGFKTIRNFGHDRTTPGDPVTFPFWKRYGLADAGEDRRLDCAPLAGADVTLDGSGSRFAVSWSWVIEGMEVATGAQPTVHLDPGTHNITLFAGDADDPPGPLGLFFRGSDAVVITVNTGCSMDICDLVDFSDQWLNNDCGEANKFCRGLDRNGDGDLDFVDFSEFANYWLEESNP